MRIAFLTPSVSRAAGGIFEIERRLGQSLALLPDAMVSVYGLHDEYTNDDAASWHPLTPRVFRIQGPVGMGYSSSLSRTFAIEPADVGHLHALWMFTSVVMHRWGTSKRRPFVVTPNGMLEPWALKNSAWKKRIAALLYERRMLRAAACLQANTEKEAADIRAFGLTNPIAIIPNGIDLPDASSKQKAESGNPPWSDFIEPGRKVLLFLSRIHPKKGLANLLRAWASVQVSGLKTHPSSPEWILAIAGWDQGGHENELKQLCDELGLKWADIRDAPPSPPRSGRGQGEVSKFPSSILHPQPIVLFLGPQFNEAKAASLMHCDAFILPSFSEGLPMAVLEAWSYGKPVLMTPECNLPAGFAAGAALRIEPDADSIARSLVQLFRTSPSTLRTLGDNGLALVRREFTWQKVAHQMRTVYNWALGGGPKPDCMLCK